jgi:glucose/mannose transport system permease protein
MSFLVTGLIWQWLMNPTLGIQKGVRDLGWQSFTFDWIVNRDLAVYALVIAGVWQAAGLVMVLMLAGLRGVDSELWKATRVDGIPAWRVYLSIILPLIRPMIVTSVVLLGIGVVKSYDLVVALTGGGPGRATELPATFMYSYTFTRNQMGVGAASAVIMLAMIASIIVPYLYSELGRNRRT